MPHESNSGCPDCGHALMEHGPSGCTHGLHVDGLSSDVCACRRGRHDPLDDDAPLSGFADQDALR